MAFLALIVLAVIVRIPGIFYAPFWSDEYFSWLTATQPSFIQFFLRCTGVDVYPPLSYVPVWLIAKVTDAQWALRLPSALAGVACVWAAVRLLRRYLTEKQALAIGALVALSPLSVFLGWEAKAYNVFALFNLLMLDEALRVMEDPRRGHKRLSLWVAGSMWSFFLSPYFIFAMIVGAFWTQRSISPGFKAVWKGSWQGMLWALPLAPFFIKTLLLFQGSSAYNTVLGLAPLFSLENFSSAFWFPAARQLQALLIFIFAVSLYAWKSNPAQGPKKMLFSMALLPPLLFLAVSALAKPNYNDRAMLISAFAWLMLAGLGTLMLEGLARKALLGSLILIQVSALADIHFRPRAQRPDYRPHWQQVEHERRDGDLVIHAFFESGLPFKYYATRQARHDSTQEMMKNLVKQEKPVFPSTAASEGIRGLWRKINARLGSLGMGVYAGLDPIFADSSEIQDAAKSAKRLWYVVASDEAARRQMMPIPNGYRGGQPLGRSFSFADEAWLNGKFKFVRQAGDMDVSVFLYERIEESPKKKPRA